MMFNHLLFFKRHWLIIIACWLMAGTFYAYAQQKDAPSDQQINDFSLAGYGNQGKKTWEISGKSADIFDEVVKLKDITGNLYGKDNIKLTSDKGDFNKTEGKVHLEQNVVVTTTSGAKLTTDSLDWDRKNQIVTTPDQVNIERENILTTGVGAKGNTALKQVSLQKDVSVEIKPEETGKPGEIKDKVVVTCDGPLEFDYEKNIANFNNNVKVDRDGSQIYCDIMDIYFLKKQKVKDGEVKEKEENKEEKKEEKSDDSMGSMGNMQVDRLVCRGNVKIVRGDNVSYSQEAIYTALDKKITLTGRPKLILYSTSNEDTVYGMK